jgi:8-oxo-dGTP diphosphatase
VTTGLKAVVVGLVEREGEVLIARKRVVDGHFLSGQWHVPGGRVEEGESVEQAVRREIREEAGIDVEVVESLGIVDFEEQGARVHWYRCTPLTEGLRAGDDVEEVQYVSRAEAVRRFPRDSGRHFPDAVREFFGLVSST